MAMQSKAICIAGKDDQARRYNTSATVQTIRNKTQAVRPYTVEQLNHHIRQVEHQEVEYLPRLMIGQDRLEVHLHQPRPGGLGSG